MTKTMSRQEEQRGARRIIMPAMIIAAVIFVAVIIWSFFMP
ncbi:hypothetical protein [Mesorhizobium sp. BR1-1-16]|nr:hypothetical protein [Mesorhizobium sp. BR1-1-16]